tara:strand:- start:173 stop:400 length:228 start_codon:yes stop_codon:yes gene_type:complete
MPVPNSAVDLEVATWCHSPMYAGMEMLDSVWIGSSDLMNGTMYNKNMRMYIWNIGKFLNNLIVYFFTIENEINPN